LETELNASYTSRAIIMSYHLVEIEKGVLGEFSKIREEFEELQDAVNQDNHVMILAELSDMIGAIEKYASKWNISLEQLIKLKERTEAAFNSGRRS